MSRSEWGTCAFIAIALLLGATTYARATSAPPLSDRNAAALIESWFAGSGWTESLATGTMVVTRETSACAGNGISRGSISESEYKNALAWAAVGLVKLSVTAIPVNRTPLAQAISTGCAPHAVKRVRVTPTAAGVALDKHTPVIGLRDARVLYARTYTAEVSKVVDNYEFRQNTDIYRVVKCLVHFRYSSIGRALARMEFGRVLESQKQIVLLKFDSFGQRWNLVTSDAAAIDSDFKTQKVADFLLQHGSL